MDVMGIFSELFSRKNKTIDEKKYNILLLLTKVGLALLSGSDYSGSLMLYNQGNSIEYCLLCRSVFFNYRNLGIGMDTLLKEYVGNCPLQLWEIYEQSVNITTTSSDGERKEIRTLVQIEKNSSYAYFSKLSDDLKKLYSEINIENKRDSLNIFVPSGDNKFFIYR